MKLFLGARMDGKSEYTLEQLWSMFFEPKPKQAKQKKWRRKK